MACALVWLTFADGAGAWGPEAHAAVGILALERLAPETRAALDTVLGPTDEDRIDRLCNWPDTIRDKPAWRWAASQHYVDLPRNAHDYDTARDCPDGLCITEAIRRYAAELATAGLSRPRRVQAFAWLCHLVGDIHQPLHAGFADDHGGTRQRVEYRGRRITLHGFWDREVITARTGSTAALLAALHASPAEAVSDVWSPADVDQWTRESHRLAEDFAYPRGTLIQPEFARRAWQLTRQRLRLAGERLALVLDVVFVAQRDGARAVDD